MKSVKELIQNPLAAVGKKAAPVQQNEIEHKPRKTEERTEVAIQDRFVSMSNALARGAQGLTLSQKRIIALGMAKTDSRSQRDAQMSAGGWQMRLVAADYAEVYGVDLDTAYTQLRKGAEKLLKTLWTTKTPAKKGKSEVITQGQWLSLAEYRPGEGVVDIVFHPKISPHLLGLRSQFLTYKLKQAAALRSVYAWRLFECVESWRKYGEWRVSIEDFIRVMDAPSSCAANFKDLRRRVIEPAIAEISKKSDLRIACEQVKAGRKVTGLRFSFETDPQGALDL